MAGKKPKIEFDRRTEAARELLEASWWPSELETRVPCFRTQDDCDGDRASGIMVVVTEDGDVSVETHKGPCRYCMPMRGGGLSHRTRNALLMLALAIKLDDEEMPI